MNKIKTILLIGLIILAIAGLIYVLPGAIYSIIPKYQIYSIKVDENYVLITRLNTLTGEVAIRYQKYTPSEHLPEPRIHKIKPIEPGFF